jgi:hypothetical protein
MPVRDYKAVLPVQVTLYHERWENKEPTIITPDPEIRYTIESRWCKEEVALDMLQDAGFNEAEAKEYLEELPIETSRTHEILLMPGQHSAKEILVHEWRKGVY